MTYPTKAICPILLEDYRKIAVEKAGTTSGMFSADDVRKCMTKVTAVSLHETIQCGGIEITAYYAGHVLGAAMFHVRVGEQSVLYSGDYNMTPDRHLGAFVFRVYSILIVTCMTVYVHRCCLCTVLDARCAYHRIDVCNHDP